MKYIANTLTGILKKDTVRIMLDRSHEDLSELIEFVKSYWLMDLQTRKPAPATIDGGTDLDLLTFLYALSGRNAAINLPKYVSVRPTILKKDEMIVSKKNRHGIILGPGSNQHNFMFNVKIKDMNVMGKDKLGNDVVGKDRNYILTNFDGKWYSGWDAINFMPSTKENKFITENELWTGNRIVFKNFVHPNRWISFFGQYYFESKLLLNILRERSSFYNSVVKDMLKHGVKYPSNKTKSQPGRPSGKPKSKSKSPTPKFETIKVPSFYVELDVPKNDTEYPDYKYTPENLKRLSKLAHKYTYKDAPKLQVMIKATELAHFNQPNRFPHWIKNVEWQTNFTHKSKRTKWDRLILFQEKVGDFGVAIRKRIMMKSEDVSPAYFKREIG